MQHTKTTCVCVAVTVFLLMILSSLCNAAEIIIVPSSHASPYMRAQETLKKKLAAKGHTIKTAPLAEMADSLDTITTKDTKAFVAIGSKAANWLHKRIEPPIILTCCLVSTLKNIGPDGNHPVSGISIDVPLKLQFELIAEALPKARSIGMLYHTGSEQHQEKDQENPFVKKIMHNLPKGWRLEAVAIDKHKTVANAIKELFNRDVDVVWTFSDAKVFNKATIRSLLLTAIRKHIPVFGCSLGFVKAGSLFGISINPQTQGTQVAELTHHLLTSKDKTITEKMKIPKYEIALNSIVAEQLSIKFPPKLVTRAKHIIKPKQGK